MQARSWEALNAAFEHGNGSSVFVNVFFLLLQVFFIRCLERARSTVVLPLLPSTATCMRHLLKPE